MNSPPASVIRGLVLEHLRAWNHLIHVGMALVPNALLHDAGNSTWSGRAVAVLLVESPLNGALQLSMPIDVFKRRSDMQASYVMSSVDRFLLFFLSLSCFFFPFFSFLFWPPPSRCPGSNNGKDQNPVSIGAFTASRGPPAKYGFCALLFSDRYHESKDYFSSTAALRISR